MKQGKVLITPIILVAVLCLIALIAGLIYGITTPEKTPAKQSSLFYLSKTDELTKAGFVKSLDGSYEKMDVNEFGYVGTMTVAETNGEVAKTIFTVDLITDESIKITDAENAVSDFLKTFANGFSFPNAKEPVRIQFADDETYKSCPANEYEALIKGYVLFEYSYRDAGSHLWILQIYSPRDGVLSASVAKHVDQTGFADYEAQINLQKDVMK